MKKITCFNEPVFGIPKSLASQYAGGGHALAAIAGGRVVALRYLRDHSPVVGEAEIEGGHVARLAVLATISDEALAPVIRELQALGDVSVGMVSCWEFVEQ